MLIYYIRHGEPIYDPDSLTEKGHAQAEALSLRLKDAGIQKIYASTSTRAYQTAEHTASKINLEIEKLDWMNEAHPWAAFTVPYGEGKTWLFNHPDIKKKFVGESIYKLGREWYKSEPFNNEKTIKYAESLNENVDNFLLSLGYEHDRERCLYKRIKPKYERIAVFAHQGFGLAFLSNLLDIPYPIFSTRFDTGHTGMTAIYFDDSKEEIIPKILQLSNDSHLYKEGLDTVYGNWIKI